MFNLSIWSNFSSRTYNQLLISFSCMQCGEDPEFVFKANNLETQESFYIASVLFLFIFWFFSNVIFIKIW